MSTMTAGTNISQRAVILVPFPYSDLTVTKKRPALVVSANSFNKRNEDVICCLITSNPKDEQHGVYITNKDMQFGSLEFDSKVKPYRVFTVSKEIIYTVLGKLSVEKAKAVSDEIKLLVDVTAGNEGRQPEG